MQQSLLEVTNLRTEYRTDEGSFAAVDDISFDVQRGEVVALVGESGCGKSATALSLMRLLPQAGRIVGGKILFVGEDLRQLPERQMRRVRGNQISMIFQEPMTSLNPVYPIGRQLAEILLVHGRANKHDVHDRIVKLLEVARIPSAEQRVHDYPHQLSGGMRQRVMIAMALACKPELVIADEPTTALDVTIQAQILDLMKSLISEFDSSMLLITHDLGVVAGIADRVLVMYSGKLVEQGDVFSVFRSPRHPYTEGLLNAMPRLEQPKGKQLPTVEGSVPNPWEAPQGCRFHPRCGYATEECRIQEPPLLNVGTGHESACWHWEQLARDPGGVHHAG